MLIFFKISMVNSQVPILLSITILIMIGRGSLLPISYHSHLQPCSKASTQTMSQVPAVQQILAANFSLTLLKVAGKRPELGTVVHAYNPTYFRGWGKKTGSLSPAWAMQQDAIIKRKKERKVET